jgi:hypothetical protein
VEKAYYNTTKSLVTVAEFLEKAGTDYAKAGIYPRCPGCDEILQIYGAHSTNVVSRFDHKNRPAGSDPLDDCGYAHRQDSRFIGLNPTVWNHEQYENVRRDFFSPDNIPTAYCFLLALCGKGNFPVSAFKKCVRRADRKVIWAYSGIPLWIIPYIMLTLMDFETTKYKFRFVFQKPAKTHADDLWLRSSDCSLVKVFADSGNHFNSPDNPFPVSKEKYLQKAGNTAWIRKPFLQNLLDAQNVDKSSS